MSVTTRICHWCGAAVTEWCPSCVESFPRTRRYVATMTPEERAAEIDWLMGPLEIPFELIHGRISALAGRPVWTHELAHPEHIQAEILRGEPATFSDVVKKMEESFPGKTMVIAVDTEAAS